MRLSTSILEIEVLLNRLEQGRIDLQPDFQRANIWTIAKKQRLIDSILRKWHVPPLHLIREESGGQSVLDGQQRLSAIWEFTQNKFAVNGRIDPLDESIVELSKLRFSELPDLVQRDFLEFQIHVVNVTDYFAEESFELFFRLNEPVSLTSAEKRNAFFGEARDQVRVLVSDAMDSGWSKDTIGFSNLRMAYDDIVARLCLVLERRSIREQVPGAAVTKKYRSGTGFSSEVVSNARRSIELLAELSPVRSGSVRFNRATLLSWLIFLARFEIGSSLHASHNTLSDYLRWFEEYRESLRVARRAGSIEPPLDNLSLRETPELLNIYDDRASARVLDANSVLARDAVIWALFANINADIEFPTAMHPIFDLLRRLRNTKNVERSLFEFLEESTWGSW